MKIDLGDLTQVTGGGGGQLGTAGGRKQAYCAYCGRLLTIYDESVRTDDGGMTSLFICNNTAGGCQFAKEKRIMNNLEVKWK